MPEGATRVEYGFSSRKIGLFWEQECKYYMLGWFAKGLLSNLSLPVLHVGIQAHSQALALQPIANDVVVCENGRPQPEAMNWA